MLYKSVVAKEIVLCISLFLWQLNSIESGKADEIDNNLSVENLEQKSSLQRSNFHNNRNLTKNSQRDNSASIDTRLIIKLSDRRVYIYQSDRFVTSYPIAIGKPGWETPLGHFQVMQMLKYPSWQHPWQGTIIPPGKDNPLGDRWIAFWSDGKNFIGFHGTPNENSVGTPASHGCIRMKNNDVRDLFDQVSVGTPVVVEP